MRPILEIKNISKKFRIQHEQQPYLSLRDSISDLFKEKKYSATEDFSALNDVSFDVFPGESIAIIGKNGAGKSTLLKILSKITPPTSGKIISRGRIASLLEVGTGFHQELSGRENIFLNGSILGMKHKEIQNKFDEIVDFSGVEKFLDTPLKHYSSGMQLRLAFAVAAFLDPEILIIDEVLAVGDYEFQKKCIGKMDNVSKSGKTILFVSHNLQIVQKLCSKGGLLEKGVLLKYDTINNVITDYTKNGKEAGINSFPLPKEKTYGFPTHIQVEDLNGHIINELPAGAKWQVRIRFTITEETKHFVIGLGIASELEVAINTSWSNGSDFKPGNYEALFTNKDIALAPGRYNFVVGLSSNHRPFYYHENATSIHITSFLNNNETQVINTHSGIILNQLNVLISRH